MLRFATYRKWKLLQKQKQDKHIIDCELFINSAITGNVELLQKCLKDVHPNHRKNGLGALHLTAQRGDTAYAAYFLANVHSNINLQTNWDETPLFMACTFGRTKIAQLLLENRANPNMPDASGKTPLHVSVRNGCIELAQLLLQFNANINALDDMQQTPLSIAITDERNYEMANVLLQHGVDFSVEKQRPLHVLFELVIQIRALDDLRLMHLLINGGVNLNEIDSSTGRNCLHFVALTGFYPLAVLLVDNGVNRHLRDLTHQTPAMIARDSGNSLIADLFIKDYRIGEDLKLRQWQNKTVSPALPDLDSQSECCSSNLCIWFNLDR